LKELTKHEEKWIEEQIAIILNKDSKNRWNALYGIADHTEISYSAIPALIDSLDIAGSYISLTFWVIRKFKELTYPHLLKALLLPNKYYNEIEPIFVPLLKDQEFEEKKNISWLFQGRDEQVIPTINSLLKMKIDVFNI